MSCQRIKIFGLLNFCFTTTYDLIDFTFALLEPSFILKFNNTCLDTIKMKTRHNINNNIIEVIAKFIYELT